MKYPDPVPGLVVRYNYLWSDDRKKGLSEGEKDRPCAIVISSRKTGVVTLVPVTHSPPEMGEEHNSLEIPLDICARLGLDDAGNWIRLGEVNRFVWPGDHLRPLPADPSRVDYGMIPQDFFEEIRKRLVAMAERAAVRMTKRD